MNRKFSSYLTLFLSRVQAVPTFVKVRLSHAKPTRSFSSFNLLGRRHQGWLNDKLNKCRTPGRLSKYMGTMEVKGQMTELMRAVNFAAIKHKDQRRKDAEKTPYINHPIGVAYILLQEGGIEDLTLVLAAVLHDTIEDTDTTYEELKSEFGDKVAGIVVELTDDKTLSKETRKALQITNAPKKSQAAKIVGMADKIFNLRDLNQSVPVGWSIERRDQYFVWARDVCRSYYSANEKLAQVLQNIFTEKGISFT